MFRSLLRPSRGLHRVARWCSVAPPQFDKLPFVQSHQHYEEMYAESVNQPETFWGQVRSLPDDEEALMVHE